MKKYLKLARAYPFQAMLIILGLSLAYPINSFLVLSGQYLKSVFFLIPGVALIILGCNSLHNSIERRKKIMQIVSAGFQQSENQEMKPWLSLN